MAKFKLIVSDSATGKSSVNEVEGARAQALIGRSLGEVIDGSTLGIAPGRIIISGGCDKNGIPMRADVHGSAKKYIVISSGPGFKPVEHGERRRKLVRGRSISDETYQVNFTLEHEGRKQAGQAASETSGQPEVKQEKPADTKTQEKKKTKEGKLSVKMAK